MTPLADLRALLAALEHAGELVRVTAEVDPRLEIAEIHRRVIAAGGPALWFQQVKGSPWPLVTNLFGSRRRIELAFGTAPERLAHALADAPRTLVPPSLGRLWRARALLASLVRVGTREVRRAPVLEQIDTPPQLGRLPLLTCWPEDGGAFVTLPLVMTEHPAGLGSNLGMYRIQRHGEDQVGLHVQIGKGGGFHLAAWEERGQPMPVAIQVGGPPAAILAAIAPLPENVPELLLASLVRQERLRLARCAASPLPLLAEAEVALLGLVRPGERRDEGPFGDHYGYYSLRHPFPCVRVHALARRRDPILCATVVGKPRQEDFFLGDYLQELLAPFVRLAMPSVRSLWSYGETGYHSLAAAIVHERYRREAMQSAFRILGEGQLSLTTFLLVTDRAVDLRDFRATLAHVLARTRLETDLYVFGNLAMDTLDYTGPGLNEGSKGVLLGLGDPVRDLPGQFQGTLPQGFRSAAPFCPGCLCVDGPAYAAEPLAAARLAACSEFLPWPLLVLVDDATQTAASPIRFLWNVFTRFEPAADLHTRAERIVRQHISHSGPLVIDARTKPSYPKELFADPATKALVSRRWREYFPAGMEMGDSDTAHLGP